MQNGKRTWKWVAFSPFFHAVPQFLMQGLMLGYATDETEVMYVFSSLRAHRLSASIRALEHGPGSDQMGKHRFVPYAYYNSGCKGEKQQKSFTLSATILEFMFVKNGAVFQGDVSFIRCVWI